MASTSSNTPSKNDALRVKEMFPKLIYDILKTNKEKKKPYGSNPN